MYADIMDWELYEDKVMDCNGVMAVTDPCYDKDVWCRDLILLPSGRYRCYYALSDEGDWGMRVKACAILDSAYGEADLNLGYIEIGEVVSNIGVDAGMAGFFINKPDYSDAEWYCMCGEWEKAGWPDIMHNEHGFFTRSGFGDGLYDVYELTCEGMRVGAMILFINDHEMY